MKKSRVLILTVLFTMIPTAVYANSSWHWLTDERPWTILPIVALATIIIESFIIIVFGKVSKKLKAVLIVIAANIVSFILPFLLKYIELRQLYPDGPMLGVFETGPYYIVGIIYLVLTLAAEIPIVYYALRDDNNKKRLLISSAAANIITTVLVFIVVRLMCKGVW
jgi:hypothetical protein